MKRFAAFLLLAGTALAALPVMSAGAVRLPRVELLREVRVAGDRLQLSALLPPHAPDALRERATRIPLGSVPLCGKMRTLDRDALMNHMGLAQDLLSQLSVPERVVVSCDARPVTTPEVVAAIQDALKSKGIDVAALSLGDVLLQSQVFVRPGDAGLRVIRCEFDAPLQRARFLMSAGHSTAPPFVVTARVSPEVDVSRLWKTEAPALRDAVRPDKPPRREILVAAGGRARLVLRSNSIAMATEVVPLEAGALGQQIRVRVVDTGKVWTARVDGRSHLQLSF